MDRHKVGLFAGYLAIAPAASAPTAAPNKTSAHPRPGAKISGTTHTGSWYLVVRPPGSATKPGTEGCGLSAPEMLGHLFRLVAAVALFELVVVAVGVVCAFVVVVFVDEDAFLAGDRFATVLAAGVFPAQDEEPED